VIGLALIIGYKSCVLSRRQDRFWFGVLLFGFCWYAGIHLLWYLAAIFIMPNPNGGSG
jgi:phage shock protein PspC (stress-responsive transcriptional regulator)